MHPILFKVGPITIYTYGVMVSTAFILCTFLMWYNAPLVKIKREKILDFSIIILVAGILGARLLHVISNIDYYIKFPFEIIMLTRGGLAFHGGLLFSFIAALIYVKVSSIPICRAADLVSPYIALGQAIGRIGCLLNGCCFGREIDLNHYGIIFPGDTTYRYPTQIYSILALLLIYMVLRFCLQKNILKNNLFLIYLILHSFQRFIIDFFRGDIPQVLFNFTLSQLLSLAIFIIASTIFILRRLNLKT